MEIGVSTSLFGSDPDPEEFLPAFKRQGIRWLEISSNCFDWLKEPAKLKELKSLLDASGVKAWSIHSPFGRQTDISHPDEDIRKTALDSARICFDSAGELGARFVIVHTSSEPIDDADRADRMHRCRESLGIVEGMARSAGVAAAVECLPRTCLGHDSGELLQLLEGFDDKLVTVCLDVNHANLREDVLDATRRYGARIGTLHVSDNDGEDERHWLPGKGIIPWSDWIKTLLDVGYDDVFMYEVSSKYEKELPPDKRLAILAKNAKELFDAAGVEGTTTR